MVGNMVKPTLLSRLKGPGDQVAADVVEVPELVQVVAVAGDVGGVAVVDVAEGFVDGV